MLRRCGRQRAPAGADPGQPARRRWSDDSSARNQPRQLVARLTHYPQIVDGVNYDHAWLRGLWAQHIAFSRRKPLILGEFGFSVREAKAGMMEAMARDFVALCDEEGWSWSQWTYKDQGHMSIVSPVAGTPWVRFLHSPTLASVSDKAHELGAAGTGGGADGAQRKTCLRVPAHRAPVEGVGGCR